MSPLDNNSSIYYFIKSYSYGPYLYGDLATGLDPLVTFILCTSSMPLLGGTLNGSSAGNKAAYFVNRCCSLLRTSFDASSR